MTSLLAADSLLQELAADEPTNSSPTPLFVRDKAPTMGRLDKVSYTHDAMIDLIISNPWISQNEIAKHFGYTPGWLSNIFASDAFQARLAERREEVVDPSLAATIKERFQALVIKSLEVLQTKLNAPTVSDNVAIRAAELGAKALGLGGHAPAPPPAAGPNRLEELAQRLVALQSDVRKGVTYEGQASVVEESR